MPMFRSSPSRIATTMGIPPPSSLSMSFMAKSSTEKLNEMMAEDYQDIPLTLLNRLFQLTKYWLVISTEQRKRFSVQLKKNWLRLLISIIVVIIQFLWFVSYYIRFNTVQTYPNFLAIQTKNDEQPLIVDQSENSHHHQHHSSLEYSIPSHPLVDAIIINMSSPTTTSNEEITKDFAKEMMFSKQHDSTLKNCDMSLATKSAWMLHEQQKPWPSFLWRILLGLKLALMMIGLELVRLFDTLWEIFKKPKSHGDDDRNRKSFIDLSYIERNRGYK